MRKEGTLNSKHCPRRKFLSMGVGAGIAAALRVETLRAVDAQQGGKAPATKEITLQNTIPARDFGKTGHRLPVLAFGGSAMVEKWASAYNVSLPSFGQRVEMARHAYHAGIRYFDTSCNYGESEAILGEALKDVRKNIYLATKVGVTRDDKAIIERQQVRESVEKSLEQLRTDYLDCVQIHGPVLEYAGYDRAMEIYEELAKLRQERLFRFIGVTGHTAFEPIYRLIDTRLFDQVFVAYGYFPKGMDTMLSHANLQWREMCLSKARELGMGILAMKVLSSFVLGHNAKNIVPEFDEAKLSKARQAAIRWALREDKPPVLVVGVSLPSDIDENVQTLQGNLAFTAQDQRLLAEFSVKALHSKTVTDLKIT